VKFITVFNRVLSLARADGYSRLFQSEPGERPLLSVLLRSDDDWEMRVLGSGGVAGFGKGSTLEEAEAQVMANLSSLNRALSGLIYELT